MHAFTYIFQNGNQLEKISPSDKIKGFAAITFLFVVLPYDKLDNVSKYFTEFEANNINIAFFYNTGEYLLFKNIDELFHSGQFLWNRRLNAMRSAHGFHLHIVNGSMINIIMPVGGFLIWFMKKLITCYPLGLIPVIDSLQAKI